MGWYSNDNKTIKLTSYAKTSAILGPKIAGDKDSTALYNANPSSEWYWFFFCFSGEPVSTGDTITVRYDVKIKYYTYLSQKVEIDNS